MEKILLVPLLVSLLCSCSTSEKKLKEMREKTHIDNPYKIENAEPDTSQTTEKAKNEGEDEEPSAANPVAKTPKTTDKKNKNSKKEPKKEVKKTGSKDKAQTKKAQKEPVKKEKKKSQAKDKKVSLPFRVGEKLTFSLKYFALKAGELKFQVKSLKRIRGQSAYHFYVSVHTSSIFSMFYSVKDYAESFWSPKYKRPFLMKIYGKESKYVREVQTSFDWDTMNARYQAKILKKGEGLDKKDKTWKLKSKRAQDIISALYYLRTFDLQEGQTHYLRVAEKGKDIVVKAKVVRKEILNTNVGKFKTLVVKPTFTVDGSWKQVGDISIWLTDDARKLPVRIDAKIKIGTIHAKLQSIN